MHHVPPNTLFVRTTYKITSRQNIAKEKRRTTHRFFKGSSIQAPRPAQQGKRPLCVHTNPCTWCCGIPPSPLLQDHGPTHGQGKAAHKSQSPRPISGLSVACVFEPPLHWLLSICPSVKSSSRRPKAITAWDFVPSLTNYAAEPPCRPSSTTC